MHKCKNRSKSTTKIIPSLNSTSINTPFQTHTQPWRKPPGSRTRIKVSPHFQTSPRSSPPNPFPPPTSLPINKTTKPPPNQQRPQPTPAPPAAPPPPPSTSTAPSPPSPAPTSTRARKTPPPSSRRATAPASRNRERRPPRTEGKRGRREEKGRC